MRRRPSLPTTELGNSGYISWAYQRCTQWGGWTDGGGVPKDRLALVSRHVTLEYISQGCQHAFNITGPPNVTAINQYGGDNISYPRLAIVGGEWDNWRPLTPLATLDVPDRLNANQYSKRADHPHSTSGSHVWDDNGVFPNETAPDLPPPPVASAQKQVVETAQGWMAEWRNRSQST